jgi:hypothetical protein
MAKSKYNPKRSDKNIIVSDKALDISEFLSIPVVNEETPTIGDYTDYDGRFLYNKFDNKFYVRDANSWVPFYNAKQVDDKFTLAPRSFNHIGSGDSDLPILSFTPGDWDEAAREIGNVFYDADTEVYVFTYTGYAGTYAGNTFIGLATSPDGITWTKQGKITAEGFEDPYVIKYEGEYYLYSEKKTSASTHLGVNLHKGAVLSLAGLTDMGVILPNGDPGSFDSLDASSPTVMVKDDIFYMFFEGRGQGPGGPTDNLGAAGLATSSDGITWVKDVNNPIIAGTRLPTGQNIIRWATHTVPDSIIILDGIYYMILHSYTGTVFATTLMSSKDLYTWNDPIGTWINLGKRNSENGGSGVPLYIENGKLTAMYLDNSVYKGYFSVWAGASDRYTVRNAVAVKQLYGANRNEYINFQLTGVRTYMLANEPDLGAGILKVIKNNITSTSLVTIECDTNVLVDGSSASIVIPKGGVYTFISIGYNRTTGFTEWALYKSETFRKGTLTLNGSGQTSVNIPHGLGTTPLNTNVNPKSQDARDAGVISWTENATNIVVTLSVPANTGTNNLLYTWDASL